ncbi:Rpn family recombination-promoting nuclease/putative transposase [Candidatus Poribacteria bacterium]|nr:Rpn family recombination-promoting nuclease/putative transposase [Candidatus Poribacteria bacterium]
MSRYIEPTTDFWIQKTVRRGKKQECVEKLSLPHFGIKIANSRYFLFTTGATSKLFFLCFSQKKKSLIKRNTKERIGIYDVYCIDEKGNRFIVEMQKVKQIYFKDRALYYSTFPISQQAEKGRWDYRLNPVYCIGILDFTFAEDERYLRRIQLSDIETHEIFYNKLTFVFIELPKFKKDLSELKNYADKWIYFLRHLSELNEIPPELSTEEDINDAFRIAEIAAFTSTERYQYEYSLKRLRDEFSIRYTGRVEGKVESLLSLIALRFEQISEIIEEKIRAITDEELLLEIQKLAIKTSTLQELEKAINDLGS